MSDEGRIGTAPAVHVNHWCEVEGCGNEVEGCGKWGVFGFTTRRGKPRWWCWEHYPHKPNKARSEAAEIAEAL
jgi:hypothetical protein